MLSSQAGRHCSLSGEPKPQPPAHSRCSRKDFQAEPWDLAGNRTLTVLMRAPRTEHHKAERLPQPLALPPLSGSNAGDSGTCQGESWPRADTFVDLGHNPGCNPRFGCSGHSRYTQTSDSSLADSAPSLSCPPSTVLLLPGMLLQSPGQPKMGRGQACLRVGDPPAAPFT